MEPILYLLIVLSLLLTPALGQKNVSATAADPKEFIGEYIYSSGFTGAFFKLLDDGKYEYTTFSDCCDSVWGESGTYSLSDNLVHFVVTRKTLNGYNLLDPEQAAEAYRRLSGPKRADLPARVIQTEHDMQIVRWGERIYLLDPDRVQLFAAAINFGIEPRRAIIHRNYLTTRFFLRRGDESKGVVGKPTLGEPWISYLQDSPIEAAITKIGSENREKIYTVNKGSADGLKAGMYLIGENTTPDYDNLLLVVSVEEGSARLKSVAIYRAANYQPGDILIANRR
jgi:hypothetical protein